MAQKYARIFVRRHYLFRIANSFPRANIRTYFRPKLRPVFIILQIFFAKGTVLKIGEYSWIFPSFSWGIFTHMMRLHQLRASENIRWIIIPNTILLCIYICCTQVTKKYILNEIWNLLDLISSRENICLFIIWLKSVSLHAGNSPASLYRPSLWIIWVLAFQKVTDQIGVC